MTVSDTGIGIATETLPHVFEPLVQEARAAGCGDGADGLGLGLAVVRARAGMCASAQTPDSCRD